jgi:hypothetical protein
MNRDWAERELAERFHDLRKMDERLAPSFTEVWQAALTRVQLGRRPRRIFPPIAAAAAVLLVAGISVAIFSPPANPPVGMTGLSQWQPSTDFLLHSPDQALLKTVPQVGASVVGFGSIISTTQAGGQR